MSMQLCWPKRSGAAGAVRAAILIFWGLAARTSWALPDSGEVGHVADTPSPLLQMTASIIVIALLGGLVILWIKRGLPRIGLNASSRKVHILETTYLAPRKAVHLLQVGSKKLLVGSAGDHIVHLQDVTNAFGPDYAEVARQISPFNPGEHGSESDSDVMRE